MNIEERRALRQSRAMEAARLRSMGRTTNEISGEMEISVAYVRQLLSDPDGSKDRERRKKYKGVCTECGGPTSPYPYKERIHHRCIKCQNAKPVGLKWTKEAIIEAVHIFAKENGRRPASTEWLLNTGPNRDPRFPNAATVLDRFGSWANAIEAAGFERPRLGQYVIGDRSTIMKERYAKGDFQLPRNRKVTPWSLEEAVATIKKASPWGVAPKTTDPRVQAIYVRGKRHGMTWKELCEAAGVRPRGVKLY